MGHDCYLIAQPETLLPEEAAASFWPHCRTVGPFAAAFHWCVLLGVCALLGICTDIVPLDIFTAS